MAKESQGCLLRRESSVAGTTGVVSGVTIGFASADSSSISNSAGFAALTTGMRIKTNSSANHDAVFTIKSTAAQMITVYETVSVQASGAAITLTGHMMQNIGDIVSFNGPSLSGSVIDVTTLLSTAKEKMIGVYDAGQVSMSVLFDWGADDAKLHDALIRDMTNRTKRQFDIIFKGNTTQNTGACYFGGYVSGFSITGSVDNAIKADITIALASGVDFLTSEATA